MNDSARNTTIKDYINDNIRPSDEQLAYVKVKYDELKQLLSSNIFRSGSFARHTAVQPIHDLDVIWVDESMGSLDDPSETLNKLANDIIGFYEAAAGSTPMVEVQPHSVKITFGDADDTEFSIDVVPAIMADDGVENEFGEPIYMVPEIIKMNPYNREQFYKNHVSSDVMWIFTDPKGYIQEAVNLDRDTEKNYRATVRLLKAWRGAMKSQHGDEWKLKSFHVEQICVQLFQEDPTLTILGGTERFFEELSHYIVDAPLIEDRAYNSNDEDKHIDEYMADPDRVSKDHKAHILKAGHGASIIVSDISVAADKISITECLDRLTSGTTPAAPAAQPVSYAVTPRQYMGH